MLSGRRERPGGRVPEPPRQPRPDLGVLCQVFITQIKDASGREAVPMLHQPDVHPVKIGNVAQIMGATGGIPPRQGRLPGAPSIEGPPSGERVFPQSPVLPPFRLRQASRRKAGPSESPPGADRWQGAPGRSRPRQARMRRPRSSALVPAPGAGGSRPALHPPGAGHVPSRRAFPHPLAGSAPGTSGSSVHASSRRRAGEMGEGYPQRSPRPGGGGEGTGSAGGAFSPRNPRVASR